MLQDTKLHSSDLNRLEQTRLRTQHVLLIIPRLIRKLYNFQDVASKIGRACISMEETGL